MTSPNPCVGALLVRPSMDRKKPGTLLGSGFHRQAGQPHAEIEAIADARRRNRRIEGATLYVTLEPCSTHGRTPACVDAVAREKISRVVVAMPDPNPRHAGRGLQLLRKQGIAVTVGVLAAEARWLNRDFCHWITNSTPWVVAKAAMTAEGSLIPPPGRRWITGPEARRAGHQLRLFSGAIAVGAETVRVDNPRLTIRHGILTKAARRSRARKPQPWRVVLTRSGQLPRSLHLFSDAHRARTLIYRKQSWKKILADLGKRGVTRLLLEGGAELLTSAFAANLVHEVAFYYAPQKSGRTQSKALRSAKKPSPSGPAWMRKKIELYRQEQLGPDRALYGIVLPSKIRPPATTAPTGSGPQSARGGTRRRSRA